MSKKSAISKGTTRVQHNELAALHSDAPGHLMLNDDELRAAAAPFLYLFTSVLAAAAIYLLYSFLRV